jgi:hypothetical protein
MDRGDQAGRHHERYHLAVLQVVWRPVQHTLGESPGLSLQDIQAADGGLSWLTDPKVDQPTGQKQQIGGLQNSDRMSGAVVPGLISAQVTTLA